MNTSIISNKDKNKNKNSFTDNIRLNFRLNHGNLNISNLSHKVENKTNDFPMTDKRELKYFTLNKSNDLFSINDDEEGEENLDELNARYDACIFSLKQKLMKVRKERKQEEIDYNNLKFRITTLKAQEKKSENEVKLMKEKIQKILNNREKINCRIINHKNNNYIRYKNNNKLTPLYDANTTYDKNKNNPIRINLSHNDKDTYFKKIPIKKYTESLVVELPLSANKSRQISLNNLNNLDNRNINYSDLYNKNLINFSNRTFISSLKRDKLKEKLIQKLKEDEEEKLKIIRQLDEIESEQIKLGINFSSSVNSKPANIKLKFTPNRFKAKFNYKFFNINN